MGKKKQLNGVCLECGNENCWQHIPKNLKKKGPRPINPVFLWGAVVFAIIIIALLSNHYGLYTNFNQTKNQTMNEYHNLCAKYNLLYSDSATNGFAPKCYTLDDQGRVLQVFDIIKAQNGKYYIGVGE